MKSRIVITAVVLFIVSSICYAKDDASKVKKVIERSTLNQPGTEPWYYSWMTMSTNGKVEKGMGATIAVTDKTGLLFYGGDLGWGALFKDYQYFHGRMVAMTVMQNAVPVQVVSRITMPLKATRP
jgi:hypothetical protein